MDKYESCLKKFNRQKSNEEFPQYSLVLFIEKQFVPHKDCQKAWFVPGIPEPFSSNPGKPLWAKVNWLFVKPSANVIQEISVQANGNSYAPSVINNLDYMLLQVTQTRINLEQIIPTPTEKSPHITAINNYDSRNWQTLPAGIDYVRIPLNKGEHEIKIRYKINGKWNEKAVKVKLQLQQKQQVMMVSVNG